MNYKARWIIIIFVLAFAIYHMYPLNKKINLGLDLQGGMHVVLAVDTDKAVEAKVNNLVYQVRSELQKDKIPFGYVQKEEPYNIIVTLAEGSDAKSINTALQPFRLKAGATSGDKLVFTISQEEIETTRDNAVLQSLEVVRNRIDAFGVSEPLIQRQGKNQILVQLPGITDPDRAINLIGQTAQLKFYIVNQDVDPDSGRIPYDTIILEQKKLDKRTGLVLSAERIPVKREAVLSGESIVDAGVQYDQMQRPVVYFKFDAVGAKIFGDVTKVNVGKRLAIVLDDNVYSAPNITEPITGGSGSISGDFTLEEANDLAIVLRAGGLPAPVSIEENRTVGPSLGADSIVNGVKASLIGLAFIFVFMLIYYKLSGLVANIGLLCNFILLLGALCWLGATLTLPGIAGVILTLGIAVDANVLIFERVREELRQGRTVMNAFEIGYQKAFGTIVDANITSLIASLVLFQFGTGPVKGFAVTLSLGLIASMFTAVFVTRTVFMAFIVRSNTEKVSI